MTASFKSLTRTLAAFLAVLTAVLSPTILFGQN